MEINALSNNLKKIGVDIVDTEEYKSKSNYENEDEFIDYKGLQECLVKDIPSYSRSQRMYGVHLRALRRALEVAY